MGSIKIYIDSFETAGIAPELRDTSVSEFAKMKRLAQDDLFYCTTEFYSHEFSYGSYWDLMFGDITELLGIPSLSGITSTTLEYFRSVNSQCRGFDELENEIAFQQCALPRAIGAFDDGNRGLPEYVCNDVQWKKWHHDWLTKNPSQIQWGDPNNEVLPYPEMVREFMRMELTDGNFSQSWKKVDFADRIDNKWRLRTTEIVNAFHYCMGCLDERERISRTKQYGVLFVR